MKSRMTRIQNSGNMRKNGQKTPSPQGAFAAMAAGTWTAASPMAVVSALNMSVSKLSAPSVARREPRFGSDTSLLAGVSQHVPHRESPAARPVLRREVVDAVRGCNAVQGGLRLGAPARPDEPGFVREDHQLRPVPEQQLGHDPGNVGLGRQRGDEQPPGYF